MAGIKKKLKQAEKKAKTTGAIMSKKERDELLGMVPSKPKKTPKYMPK